MKNSKRVMMITAALALLCAAVFVACKLNGRYEYMLKLLELNTSMSEAISSRMDDLDEIGRDTDNIRWLISEGRYSARPMDYSWVEDNRLIAHAFGAVEVDGALKTYTNSREAFERNYALGHRIFEVDFMLTDEGCLVAGHDWQSFRALAGLPEKDEPMSLEEFKDCRIAEGQLTQMTGADVVALMAEYPDIHIVTDSKYTDEISVRMQFAQLVWLARQNGTPEVMDRVIVQIYDQNMLGVIQDIFPCKSIIFTLYQTNDGDTEVLDFCAANGIGVVTMPRGRNTADFVGALSKAGIYTYIHTINERFEVAEAETVGVYGFYTDTLCPAELS